MFLQKHNKTKRDSSSINISLRFIRISRCLHTIRGGASARAHTRQTLTATTWPGCVWAKNTKSCLFTLWWMEEWGGRRAGRRSGNKDFTDATESEFIPSPTHLKISTLPSQTENDRACWVLQLHIDCWLFSCLHAWDFLNVFSVYWWFKMSLFPRLDQGRKNITVTIVMHWLFVWYCFV